MQRFVLRQNILRFRSRLAQETDERSSQTLKSMLRSAERDLALLDAATSGVGPPAFGGMIRGPVDRSAKWTREFARLFEEGHAKCLLLDPGAGLHIVGVNDAYADVAMISGAVVAGERLFDVFPENPDDPVADGVNNVYHSLQTVAETGRPDAMAAQRYDLREPEGQFVERYWRSLNTPLFSDAGDLVYILCQTEDVTAERMSLSGF